MENEGAEVPFLLEIDFSFAPKNLKTGEVAVAGRLVRGMVTEGETVDIVGYSREIKQATVIRVDHPFVYLHGMQCILQGVPKQDLWRGQVLASPGTMQPNTTFEADMLIHERVEKISQQPFQGIVRYRFHIRHTDVSGTVLLPKGKETIAHGDHFSAIIILNEPLALEVGLRFGIGRGLGQGIVTEILE